MRKESREMDSQWALEVMHKAPYITVSFIDEDGKPYGLPLSLASDDDVNWYFMVPWKARSWSNQGSSRGLPFSRNPLCAYGWSEGRQFHPAIQICHRIRQGRNSDWGCREDPWSPTDLWAFPSSTHGAFNQSIARSLSRTAVVRITLTEPPTGKRKQYDKEGVEMKYGRME